MNLAHVMRQVYKNNYVRLFIVAFIVLVGVYWIQRHGVLTIESTNETATYTLYKQEDQHTTRGTFRQSKKLILTPGTYEVTIQQGDKNYFQLTTVKGFLRSTKTNGTLKQEEKRAFIGNEPRGCANYMAGVLYTYGCTNDTRLSAHIPATAQTPTYANTRFLTTSGEALYGDIEGTVETGTAKIALVRTSGDQDEFGYHKLFIITDPLGVIAPANTIKVSDTFDPAGEGILPYLDDAKVFALRSLGTGFIIYDQTDLSTYYYYDSISALMNPTKKTLTPVNSTFRLVDARPYDDVFVAVFVGRKDGKETTEIVLDKNGSARHFTIEGSYNASMPCSKQLCALHETELDVFDISGDTPRKNFSLHDVAAIAQHASRSYVVNARGVLELDAENRSGHLLFGFGDYTYGSMFTVASNGTLLMGASYGTAGKKVAFALGQGVDTSISTKVRELSTRAYVKSVSAYGQYVFVVPSLGEPINSAENGLDYDPAVRSAAAAAINTYVKDIGFNTDTYKIINTVP